MAKHLGRLLLVVAALATGSNSQQWGTILSSGLSGKDLGDVTCNADVVQNANVRQLYPILHDLVNTTFFRLFRVKLKNPICPYWPVPKASHESTSGHDKGEEESAEGSCTGSVPTLFDSAPAFGAPSFTSSAETFAKPACSIEEEEEGPGKAANAHILEAEQIDHAMTMLEKKATEKRDSDADSCEFEEDLPTFWIDMCGLKASDEELEDVNLIKNPERNTGYNGSHIWEAMYKENCFEVGSSLPRGRFGTPDDMCYEERILYRLLSGWHASTSIAIFKSFYAPGTKSKGAWSPNPSRFMEQLGTHPDRLKNLYFSFVVMLRAVKKAGPFLDTYSFATDDATQDHMTRALIERLLDSQVLSLCSPLFEAFDETRLFHGSSPEQNHLLKRQFKRVFQNITVLVDCVQCQRCRLHAKLFSLGLGTALKILLTPANLLASSVSRDELVALVNVLWKLSEAMEDARVLSEQYWDQDAKARQEKGKESRVETPDRPLQPSRDAISKAFALESLIGGTGRPDLPDTFESSGIRASLLDTALGAVRQAANTGSLSAAHELEVLRSLVVKSARPEVLLLAKHYADRPNLFAALAFEATTAAGSLPVGNVAVQKIPALVGAPARPADAIIIGGGLAGMVATISLLDRGASVVMVEKQPYLGGNSGKASSGINAALETTVESLIGDTTKSAGVLARPDLIAKLSSDSGAAVSWLMNRTSVDLSLRSQLGGHTVKRTLRPANAFVGAEVTFAAGQVLKKFASDHPDRFRLLTKTKFVGLKPLPGGDGWRITTTPAEGGDGENLTLQATSLVLASGGFGHDHGEADSLLLKNRPDLADFPTTLGPQTTGDGVKLARDIGAKLVDMDRVQLHPTGFVDPTRPQDNTKTLAAELLRGVGGLLVDRGGKRFTDELGTRQAVVDAELKATQAGRSMKPPDPSRTFALVLNSKAAAMADRHVTLYSKKGLLTKVSGVKGLAQHLGAPVDTLQGTLESYNNAATVGKDEFNRTVFPSGHWPIEMDEDFFVGKVVPVIHYTMGGVAIDTDARVLGEKDGKPIAHLYAIGEASGGVHGDNRLAGNSLLECTVFGRHVGLILPIQNPALQSLGSSVASNSVEATMAEASSDNLRAISAEELAEHGSTAERKWVALYEQVYDLTDYVDDHPGGKEAILNVVGLNGTDAFDAVHNRELLNSMGFEAIGHFVA